MNLPTTMPLDKSTELYYLNLANDYIRRLNTISPDEIYCGLSSQVQLVMGQAKDYLVSLADKASIIGPS